MSGPRIFICPAASEHVPALPDELLHVVDIAGMHWLRAGACAPGTFVPDDPLGTERLPERLGWAQLLKTRGPVAEYREEIAWTS